MQDMLEAQPEEKIIEREEPVVSDERRALVARLSKEVIEAKKHWEKDFSRMRDNMKFASGRQWKGQSDNDDRYVANITQRILKTTVASAYAKNPTIVAEPRKKMFFEHWDGKAETAMMAKQTLDLAQGMLAQGIQIPQQLAEAIAGATQTLADIQQGFQTRQLHERIGKTMVAVIDYYMDENTPTFKMQMKRTVRRGRICGVGYVALDFQREMELSPQQDTAINGQIEQLAAIGRLQADLGDGEIDPHAAEAEELRLAIAAARANPEQLVREGILFRFPHSTRLIPSPSTEKLMGWIGTEWLAEEVMLSKERVKEAYGVDVGKSFQPYQTKSSQSPYGSDRKTSDRERGLVCIWIIYDKRSGLRYVIADGYPDFLEEPGAPPFFVEQFFPYFALTFNDLDCEGVVYPQSDVELLRGPQMEYNRIKEAMRQHRIANRPLYLSPTGAFEEEEEKQLSDYAAHSVIFVNSHEKGRPASDLLSPVGKIGVDPNLYETGSTFDDMQRVTGAQETVIGGLTKATATENSIAEGARQGGLGLDLDDMDDMLTALMRAAGQLAMTELSAETVTEICGVGAVWPQVRTDQVAKEMTLKVQAGSSGRPNQEREAAKLERLAPTLLQIPGIQPRWLAERAIRVLDDDIDLGMAIAEGLPSIISMNRTGQVGTGNPETDPAEQGGEGQDKIRAPGVGGTSQPEHPNKPTGSAQE